MTKRRKFWRLDWKYVIGEIVLLFIGINLAIWFNNWNSSKRLNQNKAVAVESIQQEINSNREEIQEALERNREILNAFNELSSLYSGSTSNVVATVDEMQDLKNKYPGFFTVEDSLVQENNRFLYSGSTSMRLEIPTVSDVAWETTQAIGLAGEFDFECLLGLERTYDLQSLIEQQIGRATDALQENDVDRLLRAIDFSNQLSEQWLSLYENNQTQWEQCQ